MDTVVMNALQSARMLSPNINEAQLLAMASNLMKMNQQVADAQDNLFGASMIKPETSYRPPVSLNSSLNTTNNNSLNTTNNNNNSLNTSNNNILNSPNNNSKTFPCTVCQKVFWSPDQLSKHMTIHPQVDSSRMFTCEICNKSFRFRSNLAEHRSVHTSLKPYVCKYCGKSSRLKGNLTKHILKHHKHEQNAFIGKDDIIVKKGKKSAIIDPIAVDYLERSMLILAEHERRQLPFCAPKQSVSITTQMLANGGSGTPTPNGNSSDLDRSGSAASLSLNGWNEDQSSLMDHTNDTDTLQTTVPSFMPLTASNANNEKCLMLKDGHGTENASMSGDEATPDSEMPVETSTPNAGTSPSEQSVSQSDSPVQSRTPNTMMGCDATGTDTAMGARCRLCQKHFRKRRNLGIHMTLKHGFPPQADDFSDGGSVTTTNDNQSTTDSVTSSQIKTEPLHTSTPNNNNNINNNNNNNINNNNNHNIHHDLAAEVANKNFASAMIKQQMAAVQAQRQAEHMNTLKAQLKMQQNPFQPHHQSQMSQPQPPLTPSQASSPRDDAKLESLLSEQDNRLCRLEKQVETVLATMYTLVQLQTGMNQTLQRFKEDTNRQMAHFTQLINSSSQNDAEQKAVLEVDQAMQQQSVETPESVPDQEHDQDQAAQEEADEINENTHVDPTAE